MHTDRLLLRELIEGDAPRIFEYRSHPEVSRFQSWGTDSAETIRAFIEQQSSAGTAPPGAWRQAGIVLLSTGELIGDCGFRPLESDAQQAEIGITLAAEFQGRGYATEALRALLDFLLVTSGKRRVFGSVDQENIRSLNLMGRVGMRKEAHLERSLWFKGKRVDEVIFAMLASEWRRGTR